MKVSFVLVKFKEVIKANKSSSDDYFKNIKQAEVLTQTWSYPLCDKIFEFSRAIDPLNV
jgi:hypothetical protein